jgi:hypothetical protein
LNNLDNPRRPYPTDADMRRGWLAKINMINDAAIFSNTNENESDPAGDNHNKNLLRSNSRSN